MKKLLIVMVAVLLFLALVGCGEQADSPIAPEETPPVADVTPEPPEQAPPASTNEKAGIIVGDILYNNIPISQLFTEPFIDLLGAPIDEREAFFFYEGLEIMGDRGDLVGYDNMAIQLWAFEPNLGLFTLNGVSLDMARAELITAFGVPYEASQNYLLIYHVSSPTIEYVLVFQFEASGDDVPVSRIGMFRTTE